MKRPPRKPWSEMTIEEKETQALVCSQIGMVLLRLNKIILSDIFEYCDTHCPNAGPCMSDCPFYKYKQAREK